ncbi:MAG: hypothetical protein WKI04_13575 [Ferruginibacter sp.]
MDKKSLKEILLFDFKYIFIDIINVNHKPSYSIGSIAMNETFQWLRINQL